MRYALSDNRATQKLVSACEMHSPHIKGWGDKQRFTNQIRQQAPEDVVFAARIASLQREIFSDLAMQECDYQVHS